ncbi:hypothetical protein HDU97_002396 [Phlyctochytrium planicorne]|nr:hypothetical protein HDU97_002396 [Phlyctochytrium planicorne]
MAASLMMKAASFSFKSKVGKMFGKEDDGVGGFFSKSTSQLPNFNSSSKTLNNDDDEGGGSSKKKKGKVGKNGTAKSPRGAEEGRPEASDRDSASLPRRSANLDEEFFYPTSDVEKYLRMAQVISAVVAFTTMVGFFGSLPSGYYKGLVPSNFYLASVFSFIFSGCLCFYHYMAPVQKEQTFGEIPAAFKKMFTAFADIALMVFWLTCAAQAALWCRSCYLDLGVYLIPYASFGACNVFLSSTFFGFLCALFFTLTTVYTATAANMLMREFCGYDRNDGSGGGPRGKGGNKKNRRSLFTIPGREEDLTHKFSKRTNGKGRGGAAGSAIMEEASGPPMKHVSSVVGARTSVTGGGGRPPHPGRNGPKKSSSMIEIEIN